MERLNALQCWLDGDLGMDEFQLAPASSDASFRRYFRVTLPQCSYIAMDAPPDKEDVRPFIRVAEMFGALGLHVPEIHARNVEQGFLLLSDMGSQDYLSALNPDSADALYGDAMQALLQLQRGAPQTVADLPPYDNALLQREMALFRDWFLQTHLQVELNDTEQAGLQAVFDALAASALEQPQVAVHRDYHSRNLMVYRERNPGILDFQDAVLGPLTYDLVSLLRDCYIAWPADRLNRWVRDYYAQTCAQGVLAVSDFAQFQRWFDLMGAQRHLKAIGIFARLNWRDHKPRYLADIPRTLGYVQEVAGRYEELLPLCRIIERHVLPRLNADGTSIGPRLEARA